MKARHRPSGAALLLSGGVREALWAQPVIRALPGVTVFARSEAMRTLLGLPEVGRAFAFGSSPGDAWRTFRRLRTGPMSLAVIAAPEGLKASLLAYFAGVPRRIGPAGSHDWWLSDGITGAKGAHPVDANRELAVAAAALARHPIEPAQAPTIESGMPATRRMQTLLAEAGIRSLRETLVLVPGSGNWTRRPGTAIWPEERFAVVANKASASAVILACGLGDDTRVRETRAGIGKPTIVIRLCDLTVEEFAILAGGSQAVVGHDGDALHIAAASGAPVIALLRPQDVSPVGRSCSSLTVEDLPRLPAQRVVSVLGERLTVDTYA